MKINVYKYVTKLNKINLKQNKLNQVKIYNE
jgi:hypothetical protein